MVEIKLDLVKSLEENASFYFEKSKKSKKKIAGVLGILQKNIDKLNSIKHKESKKEILVEKSARKKYWYEKFRWFYSSENFLVIGGRDATTNDIIVKKHIEIGDLVFHTDMAGSPFFIVKSEGREIGDITKEETAQATASYNSKAWKAGLSTSDVFYVTPGQISKQAQSGEFLGKGSFMIRGKTTYLHPKLELAIGLKDKEIIGGPVTAIKVNADKYIIITQGKEKSSTIAKKIKSKFKADVDLDDIIRFLPAGGCDIQK